MINNLSQYWWQYLLLAIASYCIGAINFSIIFSRTIKKEDIRKSGSGNAGTTNMFRVYGLPLGLLTFVCDALKGVVCCLAARFIFQTFNPAYAQFASYFAGFFAVCGHVFPAYYHFKGGKGFATTIGVMFTVQPVLMLCLLAVIVVTVLLTDRMSVAALTFVSALVVSHFLFFHTTGLKCCMAVVGMALLVFYAHRHNIKRLLDGNELPTGVRKALRKLGKKSDSGQTDNDDKQ